MSTVDVVGVEVPDIGDFEDIPVIEIHVSEGDRVAADDPLLTLESDKATMDVPAPFAGVVREVRVGVGDRVSQGTLLVTIEPAASDGTSGPSVRAAAIASAGVPNEAAAPDAIASALAAEGPPPPPPPASDAAPAPVAAANGSGPVYASPSVRRRARELGIDLRAVTGTGRKGRITAEDLERGAGPAVAAGPAGGSVPGFAPWPSLDFSKQGPVERVPRSRIQRISAPNLARNWALIPHVTHNDEADITELEAWRKRLNSEPASEGAKVTMVSFLVVACVATLKEFPDFNSSLDGDELIVKRYYNIGFAADTPGGLVVPVIKGADGKGLFEIARELASLSATARDGKLGPAEISGSTFTISSLGGIGGTSFTPIVNAPEVAILGVTRAAIKPVWDGQQFQPRLMLPLSLSYDHRVIDGAAAARFVVHLAGVLSDLRRALL
jgi:pyruvate dehydrogenase E2 component (dihydrolipoamide acetyltransferase)